MDDTQVELDDDTEEEEERERMEKRKRHTTPMEETPQIELGNLCSDQIQTIFSQIPLISLTRSKSVSKSWYKFITNLRQTTPLSTKTGLVIFLQKIQLDPNLHRTTFIKLPDETHNQEPLFIASLNHQFPILIDSCNGCLLYSKKDLQNKYWEYYIYNPIHNQCIPLPIANEVSRNIKESLAFDGFCYKNEFRVICYFWNEVDIDLETMNCQIFDSRVWKWREIQARIVNPNFLLDDGFVRGHCFCRSVFRRRNLYWLWSLCMLIYEDDDESFELIRLPNYKYSSTRPSPKQSELLWVSEDLVHYCEWIEEFNIFAYIDDDGGDENKCNKSRWRYRWRVVIDGLDLRMRGHFRVFPCAFNEDLQVLYFEARGTIFAYSLETERFEEVWNCGEPGEDYFMSSIFPFLFNSVN